MERGSYLIRFEFVEYFRGGFSVGLIRSRVRVVLIRAVGIATPAEIFLRVLCRGNVFAPVF